MTRLTMNSRAVKRGESEHFPQGVPSVPLTAEYNDAEAKLMLALAAHAESFAKDAPERAAVEAELKTLHEIKAFFDATLLTDEEVAKLAPPRSANLAPPVQTGAPRQQPVGEQASLIDDRQPEPPPKQRPRKADAAERDNAGPVGGLPDPGANSMGHYRSDAKPTMLAAAKMTFPRSGSDRLRVLNFFIDEEEHGATDYEIERSLEMKHQTASARRRDLEQQGWVEGTEDTRLTDTGSPAQVYRITEQGAREWATHARREVVRG